MRSFIVLLMAVVVSAVRAMRDLLMPRGCAGCDMPDQVLCSSCLDCFHQNQVFRIYGYEWDFGYACGRYTGVLRKAILEWKDHGDLEVTRPLEMAMKDLIAAVCGRADQYCRSQILVVPVPSSLTSVRRRGRIHLMPIARSVALELQKLGYRACVKQILKLKDVKSKSVQLHGAAARSQRVNGRVQVCADRRITGCTVILVDDIITTGSTASQCALALRKANFHPLTLFTLARAGIAIEE
ncbi:ComF family protein [Bombiscardovia coagulans]|nr:ComF family protein [Bombiscardovia coagulans]